MLTDVATLATALSDSDPPTVIDVRWYLGDPARGRREYGAGHIPTAVHLDLDADFSGPPRTARSSRPSPGGRHPLPDPVELGRVLRAAGVRAGHPVVVYDDGTGLAAARLWWTLRWAGHEAVSVLDGGFPAWLAADASVSMAGAAPATGDIEVRPGSLPVLDAASAATMTGHGVLLDVRAPVRYRGEVEPIDPVAGHVPGAVNLPTTGHLEPDGRFRPAVALRAAFASAGVADGIPVGAYCGSGVTAAHTVLALHLAGRTDAALYVGSWSDWITDPDRAVAKGPLP